MFIFWCFRIKIQLHLRFLNFLCEKKCKKKWVRSRRKKAFCLLAISLTIPILPIGRLVSGVKVLVITIANVFGCLMALLPIGNEVRWICIPIWLWRFAGACPLCTIGVRVRAKGHCFTSIVSCLFAAIGRKNSSAFSCLVMNMQFPLAKLHTTMCIWCHENVWLHTAWQCCNNLVDPASSHMLVSKIKPCMSQFKPRYGETANGSLKQLWSLW